MVLLRVQEAGAAGDLWVGGFAVALPASTAGKVTAERLTKLCNAQLRVLAAARRSQNASVQPDATLLRAAALLFPALAAEPRPDPDDPIDDEQAVAAAAAVAVPHDCLAAVQFNEFELWWIKKRRDLDTGALKDWAGSNNTSKLRVFVSPRPPSSADVAETATAPPDTDTAQAGDELPVAGFDATVIVEVSERKAAFDSFFAAARADCAERSAQAAVAGATAKAASKRDAAPTDDTGTAKRQRLTDVSGAQLLARLQAACRPGEEAADETWALPKERLERLEQDTDLRAQLRDNRLLDVLLEVLRAKDRFKALEDAMDADARLGAFVDRVLGCIGAQRMVGFPDGSRRVESCINEILESRKPSFLSGLPSGQAKDDD